MKKINKIIIISVVIISLLALALFGAMMGAGNDGYAQEYQFEVNSTILIQAVKNLKKADPLLNPPAGIYDPDFLDTANSRFNAEIYSKKENTSFAFFVEQNYKVPNKSSIYLVSINSGVNFRDWKIVNRDLNRDDNLYVKKVFEEEILKKLNLNYKNQGNNMFIFWK